MKVLIKFGDGPTRSLNKVITWVISAIIAVGFLVITDWAIDAEIAHNDMVVSDYINK